MIIDLRYGVVEKDPEVEFKALIKRIFPYGKLWSPHRSDGCFICRKTGVIILFEFKFDKNIKDIPTLAIVLCQCIRYLRDIVKAGDEVPNVIFIGTKNYYLIMNSSVLLQFLDFDDVDWRIPANKFHTNKKLLSEVISVLYDEDLYMPNVYDDEPTQEQLRENIINISKKSDLYKIKICPSNAVPYLKKFRLEVLGRDPNNLNMFALLDATLFYKILTDPIHNCLSSHDENYLLTDGLVENMRINPHAFRSFFAQFSRVYNLKEKELLAASYDIMLQDGVRRFNGEFYTPKKWVDKAVEYMISVYGEDCLHDPFWDPGGGTGNLIKYHPFKEAYISTLFEEEIQIILKNKYTDPSRVWIHDFLNETGVYNCPASLRKITETEKAILRLFMNPPFKDTGNNKKDGINSVTKEVTDTKVNRNRNNTGNANNKYLQFLAEAADLAKTSECVVTVASFMPASFFTNPSNKTYRYEFFKRFKFVKGFTFESNAFPGVSGGWPVAFVVFVPSDGTPDPMPDEFELDVMDTDCNIIGQKKFYNLDNVEKSGRDVCEVSHLNGVQRIPCFTSGLNMSNHFKPYHSDTLCYASLDSNNVKEGANNSYIASGPGSYHNIPVIKQNLLDIISHFSARKLGKITWINQRDEFFPPDKTKAGWQQWLQDCVIFTIFNTSCQTCAIRNVVDKDGNSVDIRNNLMFAQTDVIKNLANQHSNPIIIKDLQGSTGDSRPMQTLIPQLTLSAEASAVLHKGMDILALTFPYRTDANLNHLHLNCWDIGWYQIKLLADICAKEELEQFRMLYTKLANYLRPGLYDYGFVK